MNEIYSPMPNTWIVYCQWCDVVTKLRSYL